MKEEYVVLVNDKDEPLGTMEKIEAHEKGLLHRAFSVFILNENNEIMLQQRAENKYH
jgi:isopentenyl-diphosphate delta-isomerase